jgi:hypothetical protein
MYQIPDIEDKAKALYIYLESNKTDTEGDSWYYHHNPNIVFYINSLSKIDCEKLISQIWDWEESILCNLADPFLDISNPNLDGYYLYGKIFLKIKNVENEEYLIENIHLLRSIAKRSQPIQFYLKLADKIALLNDKENGKYNNAAEQIRLKIFDETN